MNKEELEGLLHTSTIPDSEAAFIGSTIHKDNLLAVGFLCDGAIEFTAFKDMINNVFVRMQTTLGFFATERINGDKIKEKAQCKSLQDLGEFLL